MYDYVDFHIHSKHSDGVLSPQEIILYMKNKGIGCISITDHNTINGHFETLDLNGMQLISGVEVDVDFGCGVQLLCYNFDIDDTKINESLAYIQLQRKRNSINLIKKLLKMGICIEYDDDIYECINDFDNICAIIKENGFGNSVAEVKERFFVPGGDLYFDMPTLDTYECIKMFQRAGGKVILAHPGRISKNIKKIESIVCKLMEYGIDGIECYHPDHNIKFIKEIVALAQTNSLIITGGSDMHDKEVDYYVNKKNIHMFI